MKTQAIVLALVLILACTGASHAITLLAEDFEGGLPPDWPVVDLIQTGFVWWIEPTGYLGPFTNLSDPMLAADHDQFLGQDFGDTVVTTRALDCTGITNVTLEFGSDFQNINYYVDEAFVYVTDSTKTIHEVLHYAGVSHPDELITLDISTEAAGDPEVTVGWRYKSGSNWSWWWAIDNIVIRGDCANPVDEALQEENGNYSAAASPGNPMYFVSCIAPSDYPSFLTEISTFASNDAGGDVEMTIFTDPDGSGGPEGTVFWMGPQVTIPDDANYTVSLAGIPEFAQPILSGSWCIGFYSTTANAGPHLDMTSSDRHSYLSFDGVTWELVDDPPNNMPGDFAFRGVSQYCPDFCACYINGRCYGDGASPPGDPCVYCDPLTSITTWTLNDGALCQDDGAWCNGDEVCSGGTCSGHTGDPCADDGLWCNGDEFCDEVNDQCSVQNIPDCSDDGQYCNGQEFCDETNVQCDVKSVPSCPSDGVWCNGEEFCDEANDQCGVENVPDCSADGLWCNGDEFCDEANDQCSAQNVPDCSDDGVWCNGEEFCDETNDQCDVQNIPDCSDDGQWCNGEEFCDEANDQCDVQNVPSCPDDGIWCNGEEFCDETNDQCDVQNVPDCADDGAWCNGAEFCDEANDKCDAQNVPDCSDDGLFCNGDESCDETTDQCISSGDPCLAGEICNETTDTCDPAGDDDDNDDDDIVDDDDTVDDDDDTNDDDAIDDDDAVPTDDDDAVAPTADDDDDSGGCCG